MKVGKKLVFCLVSLVLSLLIIDFVIGILSYIYIKPADIQSGLPAGTKPVAHPYKAYMNRPGGTLWYKGEPLRRPVNRELDYGVLDDGTTINEFGHQVLPTDMDIHHSFEEHDEYRILFLGGSTTFLPWPFLTAQVLNRSDLRNVKVINASTGGYTSQENMIDLITSGFSYDPDLVIAYLPINDVYWAAHYPGFKRDYTHMRTPLKTFIESAPPKPKKAIHSFPFVRRLIDTISYNSSVETYKEKIDLGYYTTHQPEPIKSGHTVDPEDFDKTVDAVIDNVFNIQVLCKSRGIEFVLITQKIFHTDNSYYTSMDTLTLKCIELMKASDRLCDVRIIEMQKLFPDNWDRESVELVKANFPKAKLDFAEPMAYDSMHFCPAACHLFAALLANKIAPIVGTFE